MRMMGREVFGGRGSWPGREERDGGETARATGIRWMECEVRVDRMMCLRRK